MEALHSCFSMLLLHDLHTASDRFMRDARGVLDGVCDDTTAFISSLIPRKLGVCCEKVTRTRD